MFEELSELKDWLEEELYLTELCEDREEVMEEIGIEGWKSTVL